MKKALKIFGVGLAGVLVLLMALSFFVFSKLPSPHDLKRSLQKKDAAEVTARPSSESTPQATSADPKEGEAGKAKDTSATVDPRSEEGLKMLEGMIDPKKPRYQVCENIRNVSKVPGNLKYDTKTYGQNLREALLDDSGSTSDPLVMATLGPIRHFLRQPEMSGLLQMITQVKDEGALENLKQKAWFYAKILVLS